MNRIRYAGHRWLFDLGRRLLVSDDPWIRERIRSAQDHLRRQIAEQKAEGSEAKTGTPAD